MAFTDRIERLESTTRGLPLLVKQPLLHTIELNQGQLSRITGGVINYLWCTLSAYHRGERFAQREDLVEAYGDWLLKLPNITPNGLMLPKEPTALAYNNFHRMFAEVFVELGLDRHFSHVQFPINLRLVEGTPQAALDRRARSATKLHSDIWAGDPAGAIIAMLPLLGDVERLGVEYFEPREMPENLVRPLTDFAEGAEIAAQARRYSDGWCRGGLTLFDAYLLHQTQKPGPGLRLSLDFRCLARDQLASDGRPSPEPLKVLFPVDEWLDYGRGRLLVTKEPLAPFKGADRSTVGYEVMFGTQALST